jgi:hypothetical protein
MTFDSRSSNTMSKILALSLTALWFGVTTASATESCSANKAASCCAPGAACCHPGSECCATAAKSGSAAACCAPGAACCAPGAACCGVAQAKSCCHDGAECCVPGATCCTAATVKAPAKEAAKAPTPEQASRRFSYQPSTSVAPARRFQAPTLKSAVRGASSKADGAY